MDFSSIGRGLLTAGLALAAVGLCLIAAGRIPFLGRLPGDIAIRREGFQFYFPLATCLLLSVVISILMNWWNRR